MEEEFKVNMVVLILALCHLKCMIKINELVKYFTKIHPFIGSIRLATSNGIELDIF